MSKIISGIIIAEKMAVTIAAVEKMPQYNHENK